MKRFSEQLNKKAQTVKLQAAEKNELRERLVSYMEYHPLPADVKAKSTKKAPAKIVTEAYTAVSIPFSLIFKSSAVAAAIVLVVVPFVAEKSVPGDTLYAVKVQFNEELRSTLTFDSYQKVEWETERLNRRIAEARLLANEGRLTEEIEAEVAEAVKVHTENAQKEIAVLRTQDEDEATIAAIALDTTLKVQSDTLRNEEEDKAAAAEAVGQEPAPGGLIAAAIEKSLDISTAQKASSTLPSYDKMMARVEQNTTRVYELLDSLREAADETELNNVTRRIADIERTVADIIQLRESDEEVAREELVSLLQRTQSLIVFMTELHTQKTVDIEEVVPVVLTDDEKAAYVASSTENLVSKVATIESFISISEDDEVVVKIIDSKDEILVLSEKMSSSTDFAEFKVLSAEAHAMADDVLTYIKSTNEVELETDIIDETVSTTTSEIADIPTTTDEVGEEIIIEDLITEDPAEETTNTN